MLHIFLVGFFKENINNPSSFIGSFQKIILNKEQNGLLRHSVATLEGE